MGKKLLFVGAGAIGSYLGAFLSRAGHDVTLVDPWADQVETIRERGISVTGPHEPFEARPSAVHLHEAARLDHDYEIAFVAMKVYDTPWATRFRPCPGSARSRSPQARAGAPSRSTLRQSRRASGWRSAIACPSSTAPRPQSGRAPSGPRPTTPWTACSPRRRRGP